MPSVGGGSAPLLLLETVLSMPIQEMRMWPFGAPQRRERASRLIDKSSHRIRIIRLP
jgi:hypothetical protein